MDHEADYNALAEQAERLGATATSAPIASGWRQIAEGFRELARLHRAALRRFRSLSDGEGEASG